MKKEASVILAKCAQDKLYGIRIEKRDNDWVRTWAFKLKEETAEKIDPYGKVPMPQVYLTNDEIDETRGISGDLETFIEEEEARFITGQIDPNNDEDWDNYVSTLENMGVERLLEIYNEALNR